MSVQIILDGHSWETLMMAENIFIQVLNPSLNSEGGDEDFTY